MHAAAQANPPVLALGGRFSKQRGQIRAQLRELAPVVVFDEFLAGRDRRDAAAAISQTRGPLLCVLYPGGELFKVAVELAKHHL